MPSIHKSFQRMPLSFSSFTNYRLIPCALLLLMLMLVSSGCIRRSRDASLYIKPGAQTSASSQANVKQSGISPQDLAVANQTDVQRININRATARDLERLPGIGPGLAERIIAHRERFGPFRRPEHLLIVRGISDKRFQTLRDLITVE
jgi:competence ComEA-like helix-hairpin-helix protein